MVVGAADDARAKVPGRRQRSWATVETMSGEVVDDELPVDEIEDIVLKASFGTLDRAESQLVGV